MEKLELMTLLFLHGMALGSWFVPIGSVLESANLRSVIPFAFATSAVAALLSPLFFGAMADRSVPPIQVLRWLGVGTACFVGMVAWGIHSRWNPWLILLLIQLQSLLSVPTNSLTGSIVFARIGNSHRQFGAIRAMGTAGWIAGCWLISAMHVDANPRAFQISALLWIALAAYTLFIPKEATIPCNPGKLTLRERFGLDAWSLLKIHDHRVIFT
ncbi:MAG: MFS transporter, partial [Pirellula sp.]